MKGATLCWITYVRALQTLVARLVQVSPVPNPAKTNVILAFWATPPDHSISRSDSPSSPGQRVAVPPAGVIVTVLAGSPAALRKLFRSVVLTVLCPMIAMFCPDPPAV